MRITENGRKHKVLPAANMQKCKIPPGWGGTFGGSLLSIIAHVPGGISYDSSWYGYR